MSIRENFQITDGTMAQPVPVTNDARAVILIAHYPRTTPNGRYRVRVEWCYTHIIYIVVVVCVG